MTFFFCDAPNANDDDDDDDDGDVNFLISESRTFTKIRVRGLGGIRLDERVFKKVTGLIKKV